MIQDVIAKSSTFAAAIKGKKKVVASTLLRFKEKDDKADSEFEFAEALHFDYDSGRTIRTLFNLTEGKAVKVEALEAYPTPLADEEFNQAITLATEKDERVSALRKKHQEADLEIQALAPVISDKKNKRFGKRLAILTFMPKTKLEESVSVTVNLTDDVVLPE